MAGWFFFLAATAGCAVNEGGPATPGSPAATELATVERVSQEAAEIEALAEKLEAMTDAARAAAPGPDREAIIQEMRALMDEIKTRNDAMQGEVKDLEARIHTAAGDPTWGTAADEE